MREDMAMTGYPSTALLLSILRHIVGYCVLFPAILVAIALQALIVGPLLKDQATIPHLIYRACGMIFGVRFELNPGSASFNDSRVTMFVSNHLSRIDFAGLYLFPVSAVMMNANFFRMPVFGPAIRIFAHCAGIVGTEQNQTEKRGEQEKLARAMDARRNIFVFAEGIQTDGRRLLRYSKGAAEIFYDADLITRHPVLRTAQVQPVVLRVKTIEGEDVISDATQWSRYALAQGRTNIFVGMSRLSMVRSVTIDVLVCAPLDPRAYDTAEDLINAAHDDARKIIAPNQTVALTRRQWKDRLDRRDFSV